MRVLMTMFGILLMSFSVWAQVPKPGPNQIICAETSGSEADGEDESQGDPQVGIYTIDLDGTGKVLQVAIDRKAANGLTSIKRVLTTKDSTFTRTVRQIDPESDRYMGISQIEIIEGKSTIKGGDSIMVQVNDHSYAGPVGSTVLMTINKKKFTTESSSMVDCKGNVLFPNDNFDASDLDLE